MTLPHAEKAEKAAIGCCIQAPELASEFKPEWFFDSRLARICHIIQKLVDEREAIDFAVIYERSKGIVENAMVLLNECDDNNPTAATYGYWRDILIDTYNRRKAVVAADEFIKKAPDANGEFPLLVGKLESALEPETKNRLGSSDGKGCAQKLLAHLEHRYQHRDKRSGIVTGFHRLDELTDGIQFGEQTLIAARPSIGKTAIAVNIVSRVCLTDRIPTLFVSLEMSTESLMRRLLSCSHRVQMGALRNGTFTETDFQRFSAFTSEVSKAPLYVVDGVSGMDTTEYTAVVRRHVRRFGVRFVITDYLQKLKCTSRQEKRTYEVGEVSGIVRGLAVRTKAAFLTLAQLNRESEKEKGRLPRISDIADSGQIDRDADTIALLHRDRSAEANNEAVLYIAKQRDGDTGPVNLNFRGEYCMFENPIV